jgi:hypothetical protein
MATFGPSKQDHSEFFWFNFSAFHDPVVKVIIQIAVSHLEMQFLEHGGVVHQVETIVHIEALDLGQNKGILDQHVKVNGSRKVVE